MLESTRNVPVFYGHEHCLFVALSIVELYLIFCRRLDIFSFRQITCAVHFEHLNKKNTHCRGYLEPALGKFVFYLSQALRVWMGQE